MVVLVLGLLMSGVFTPMIGAVSLVVATDKSSYSKGETMTVSVTGGTGSGIVQLQFNDPSGVKRWAAQDTFTVGGAFVYELKIPDGWSVGSWTVIAKDSTSDATASRAFTITNVAPVADAGPDKSGSVGTVFSFSGAGSTDADGSIVGYAWNFGDLGTGTGVTVTHSYAAVGTYTVTLTVTDDDGATDTDTAVVTVTGVIPPPVNQRPVAMAGADRLLQIGEASTFDGSGSYDLDGVIMSYSWSFGDGQTASGAIVTHSYTLAGRYVSTLTVTDDDGATGTDSVAVTVNAPPVADAGVDQTTTPNTAVNFDGSASKDADGTITAYSWVFGDGASGTGVTTTHTYTALGNYSVTLTVTDNTGATGSDAMMVRVLAAPNQPPVANAGSAKSGHLGEVLTFDGSASRDPDGTIAKYEWEFGDGATAAGAIVTHAYEVEGVYSVRLTVTDNLGAQARATATATITNLPPVARLGGDRHVFTGFTLDFVGSSSSDADGSIAAYAWSFGDGASDSGASVSHTWAAAGSYTVTLTVTDNKGKTGSASVTVTVEDLPVTPKAVEEKQVEANATEQTLDFTEKAESKIRLNTTAPTKVTVIVFPRNPYPVSILPANTIAKYVDVSFSNIDAVKFPIYFEITYTDAEAAGKNPNKFAIYHYKDGAWVKARHTGVDKARKIIWALLDKDEVRGSTFTIAEAPLPPSFTVTELTLAPTQAKTGDSVTVTAKVKNSGELSGAYTADLYVNGAKVDSKTQTIAGGNATATYTFTLTAGAAGSYAAKVGDKTATFVVTKPLTPPNFVYSDLKVTPTTVVVGGNVTVTATVKNTGEQLGLYVVQLAVDGTQKLDMTGSLAAGGSATIKWSVKATTEGTHTVQLRDLQATFTATKPVTPPPTTPDYTWYIVGGLLGIVVLVAVWYILGRRPKNP